MGCPDEHGKYHKCCQLAAKCSYKNQCPGLAGDCCPTPGGQMLGCCLKESELELDETEETELATSEEGAQGTSAPVVAIGGFAVGAAVTLGVLMKLRSGSNERPGYVTLS